MRWVQKTLFDEIEIEEKREEEAKQKIKNEEELDKWAFLYTATATGNNSGIHFMMTLEDAKKWCSSPLSRGSFLGAEWAYFFTSVKNFVNFHCWGMDSEYRTNKIWGRIDLRRYSDNGKWDEKIMSLGLTKYNAYDMKRILGPLGIEILTDFNSEEERWESLDDERLKKDLLVESARTKAFLEKKVFEEEE